MRTLINRMAWLPFGFPLGWIGARISDGKYYLAAADSIAILALIGLLYIVGWLEDGRRT